MLNWSKSMLPMIADTCGGIQGTGRYGRARHRSLYLNSIDDSARTHLYSIVWP
jgi:hypothetical protein